MLSEGRLSQEQLLKEILEPAPLEALQPHLGDDWESGYCREKDFDSLVVSNSSFGTQMKTFGEIAHAVVIDGFNGRKNIDVRDPWHPSKYEMDWNEFSRVCTRHVVCKRVVLIKNQ
jgi:hypothetical protein